MLLGAVAALAGGCGSTEPFPGRGPEAIDRASSAPVRSRWSPYLQVMSDKERTEFLAMQDEGDREQWLRRNGMDVRVELSQKLARGISEEAALRRISDKPDSSVREGSTTMLFFSRFNTQSRTHFWMKFEDDQLLSWNSYTRERQDREREVLEFENKLQRRFDVVLERGMGINEINRQAANAREDLNRVELAYRERTADAGYRGVYSAPGSRDYIIAENLLYAQTRNEMFEWFQGRQPDKVIQQRPFETHRYFTLHRGHGGQETVVTVEFVFEDGKLLDWFVFHDS